MLLAWNLTKAVAVALKIPADGIDDLLTYPRSDMELNFYPGTQHAIKTKAQTSALCQGGLGSHTDLQCFTVLFQDDIGGLQVLTKEGQWIEAPPIEDTLIVNTGDFSSRIWSNKWGSTVHRVEVNRMNADRISIPLFLGFNFNKQCAVLQTYTGENNPPKYAPLSCGEVYLQCSVVCATSNGDQLTEVTLKRSYAKTSLE